MNIFKTSFKNNQQVLKFLGLIALLGLLIGFLISKKLDNTGLIADLKNLDTYLNGNHLNFILLHFITISVLLTCSLTGIGLIMFPLFFLFESVSLSYNVFIFMQVYHFKGLIFSLFFSIITKTVFLILLISILKKIIFIFRNIIKTFTSKEEDIKYSIFKNVKTILLYFLFIIINDILLYFIGSKLLLKLTFILK